jgi:penicillin-binding protein 2
MYNVISSKTTSIDYRKLFNKKILFAVVTVFISFTLLGIRMWYLQIVHGNYFSSRSESNRIEPIYLTPPRGLILDRKGVVLANNRASFNIQAIPEVINEHPEVFDRLALLLNITASKLRKKYLDERSKVRRFEYVNIETDVDKDIVAKVASHTYFLPGISVGIVPVRNYPFGNFASHILGYVREISADKLSSDDYSSYHNGDVVGQTGVESVWEQYLQGQRGLLRVVVNATGIRVGELHSNDEIQGSSLWLTLDYKIQKAAENSLKNLKGAIVALDAQNGQILAMASNPAFNPEDFVGDLNSRDWLKMTKEKHLFHRALQGVYPPGSTFKIFLAIAGIAEGVITPKEQIKCPGYYWFGRRQYKCWKHSGHGNVDLFKALVSSCDVYFYMLGHRLGIDRIKKYSHLFGLGEKSGVSLPDESSGLVPSRKWKKQAYADPANKIWFPGETLSVAIGQGAVTITPLQLATAVVAAVNGGKWFRPQIMRKITSPEGHQLISAENFSMKRELRIAPEILDTVKDALVGVVNAPSGTGARARLDASKFKREIIVGGKTGTAQVVGLEYHKEKTKFEDHAWFVGFAPEEDPKIVVASLIENGGHGGSVAAPAVKEVMEAYFKTNKSFYEKSRKNK